MLRKQIADLQEYRQAGVTTFPEAEKYEKDKAARVSHIAHSAAALPETT